MATMTTKELCEYYPGLLIIQYNKLPKASATIQATITPMVMPQTSVQQIDFSVAPTSGTFVLSYDGNSTASINWDDDAATIQTELRSLPGLESVTVSGAIADLSLEVTFTGVTPPALSLAIESNLLLDGSASVSITITETDEILPLAVQNGFNLIEGTKIAVGAQLDILGKYVGVSRTGRGFSTNITLGDDDYLSLIRMAILRNSAGSSLATIDEFIHMFFSGDILVFDYQDMSMSYFISSNVGSLDLLEMFISQGLLPKPMAVQINVIIYAPSIDNFFGFRTYGAPAFNASPFNSYADYHLDYPWLSYAYAILI